MKTRILSTVLFSLMGAAMLSAQEGIGTNNPDPSSALDISSTTKGILIPRMTTAARNAIASPAEGLRVYDTDTKDFWYFDGTVWVQESANAGEWADGQFNGQDVIYAKQSAAAGDTLVITDTGNLYVGMASPATSIDAFRDTKLGVYKEVNQATNAFGNDLHYGISADLRPNYTAATNQRIVGLQSGIKTDENSSADYTNGSAFRATNSAFTHFGSGQVNGANAIQLISSAEGTGGITNAKGAFISVQSMNANTIDNALGVQSRIYAKDGGVITNGYSYDATTIANNGTIENYRGLNINPNSSSQITNSAYGIYINSGFNNMPATDKFAIFSNTTVPSYILGEARFGSDIVLGSNNSTFAEDTWSRHLAIENIGLVGTQGSFATSITNNLTRIQSDPTQYKLMGNGPAGSEFDNGQFLELQPNRGLTYATATGKDPSGATTFGAGDIDLKFEVGLDGIIKAKDSVLIGSVDVAARPDNPLHIMATADPIKLEGLQDDTNPANKVVVADANGVLKTTDASALAAGEWEDATFNGNDGIRAKQVAANGDTMFISDFGEVRANADAINGEAPTDGRFKHEFKIGDEASNTTDYNRFTGMDIRVNKRGTGLLPTIEGLHVEGNEENTSTGDVGTIRGLYLQMDKRGAGSTTDLIGIHGLNRHLAESGGNVTNMIGLKLLNQPLRSGNTMTNLLGADIDNTLRGNNVVSRYATLALKNGLAATSSGANITNWFGIENLNNFTNPATIENAYGFYNNFNFNSGSPATVNNLYGLYLDELGSNINANKYYAIYTKNGDIRFGGLQDDANPANKVVVADANGVLKTTDASALAAGEWEDDGAGGIRAKQAFAAGQTVNLTDTAEFQIIKSGTEVEAQIANAGFANAQNSSIFAGNSTTKNVYNYLESNIDNGEAGDSYWSIQNNLTEISTNNTDYANQWGIMNVLSKKGTGNITGGMRGISSEAYINSSASGNANNMIMLNGFWSLASGSSVGFNRITGLNVGGSINSGFSGTVTEMRGASIGLGSPAGLVQDKYGLFIGNITNGTNSNYSIYTEAGDIRFGGLQDDANPANKVVVADANGVLKTTTSGAFNNNPWDNPDGSVANQSSTNITYQGGNVGIGIPTAAQKLEVNGVTKTSNLELNGNGGYIGSNIYYNSTWQYRLAGQGGWYLRNNTSDFQLALSPSDATQPVVQLYVEADNGNVGLGTNVPTERIDVNGTARLRNIQSDTNPANQIVVADVNGVLKKNNAANLVTRSKIFYPPAVPVNITTTGTSRTLDLHQEYVDLYGTPAVTSPGAAALPTFAETELDYYVLDFDTSVFANVSIAPTGVLTYDVISVPPSNTAYFNVVFQVK